jgi:NitT/TauT family transport system substrate-binding protein
MKVKLFVHTRVASLTRPPLCLCVSVALLLSAATGCKDDTSSAPTASEASGATKVRLTLDWKPEPEFGGFYAAKGIGAFEKHGLDVDVKPAGAGAPTWQLVATGKTEFATTAADQVLVARAQGADVVALFAVYQTSPQGIMVRKSRGFTKLADVFTNPGTLAAENNAWLQYCRHQFQPVKVTLTGYTGGVGAFLAKADYAQQCFVFSEPILARKQDPSIEPQTFLIAESGYNPYTTVVITSGEMLRTHPARVKAMAEACRAGWRAYLDDPGPANKRMSELNTDMDLDTFTQGAAAQKPLIETEQTKELGLGAMTAERWTTLGKQLLELKLIPHAAPAEKCFVDVGTMK